MNELVSIIMPVFNSEHTVGKAIHSVLDQSYTDWELIVINDGSTDSSMSEVLSFSESRISIIDSVENCGVSSSRNKGIESAKGKYICFLDADDIWFPDKLKTQVSFMEKNEVRALYSSYCRANDALEIVGYERATLVLDYPTLLKRNYVGNLTGIYDCSRLGKIFQPDMPHEDYAMWLDIARKTQIVPLDFCCAVYRVGRSSLTGNKLKSLVWHFQVLRNHCGLPWIQALILVIRRTISLIMYRLCALVFKSGRAYSPKAEGLK